MTSKVIIVIVAMLSAVVMGENYLVDDQGGVYPAPDPPMVYPFDQSPYTVRPWPPRRPWEKDTMFPQTPPTDPTPPTWEKETVPPIGEETPAIALVQFVNPTDIFEILKLVWEVIMKIIQAIWPPSAARSTRNVEAVEEDGYKNAEASGRDKFKAGDRCYDECYPMCRGC